MKSFLFACALFLVAGCSNSESSDEKQTTVSSQESVDSSNTDGEQTRENSPSEGDKKGAETVRIFLEKELSGPSDELKRSLDGNGKSLTTYVDENYKSLFQEDNFETFITQNYVLMWLPSAHGNDYQIEAKEVQIEKVDDLEKDVYRFEVEVEWRKGGESGTGNVTGRVNTNDQGKISAIRQIEDSGLPDRISLIPQ
ncbi:hypothetical protein [Halobacillus sp. K22]|uniref:hypothetical protein n=1 Tax=Halobacillus sp. K22 TaxID=3457431 RepID=UPI003FCCC078